MFEVKIPAIGESITEATVGAWFKEDGSFVEKDEIICELESEKASFEQIAEISGILHIKVAEGETVEIGTLIAHIEEKKKEEKETTPHQTQKPEITTEQSTQTPSKKNYPSPAAHKILNEKEIDVQNIEGTGKEGRITKADVLNAITTVNKDIPKEPSKDETLDRRWEEKKRMTTMRKTIAKKLVEVKNKTAMLTTFNEVDMKPVMDIRKKYKELFKEKHQVGLGFMSFFTRAVCLSLKEWIQVNARIEEDNIIYPNYCDISIAVSTPKGLVVPVIRDADTLDFYGIEKEILRLATRARENKLTIEEMSGGTFTITNGGIFGSMLSTPIINSPQSAILGMHNILQRPVVVDGQITIRPIMYVALSYDHRIIDGKQSVSFLYRIKEFLEDPTRMMIGV